MSAKQCELCDQPATTHVDAFLTAPMHEQPAFGAVTSTCSVYRTRLHVCAGCAPKAVGKTFTRDAR